MCLLFQLSRWQCQLNWTFKYGQCQSWWPVWQFTLRPNNKSCVFVIMPQLSRWWWPACQLNCPPLPHQMAGHWYPPLCPHLFNYYSALWLAGSPIARGTHKQQHAHGGRTTWAPQRNAHGGRDNATSHNCVNPPSATGSGLICTTVGENLCAHPGLASGPLSPISKLMFATTTTSAPLCESPHHDHHDNQCTMQRRTTQGSYGQPTVGENCDHPAWAALSKA